MSHVHEYSDFGYCEWINDGITKTQTIEECRSCEDIKESDVIEKKK